MFFKFFQHFDFLGSWGCKRAKKWPKATKNLSVSLHISGSIHYVLWLWFLVSMCKVVCMCMHVIFGMHAPDIFRCYVCSFKILIFQVVRGAIGQKMSNDKKSVCLTPYLRKYTSYDCDSWYACVKWNLQVISSNDIFQNFDFLGC